MAMDAIQEVKIDLELHAKKTAALLAASSMPEGVKEAWVALAPHMSVKQLARFADILEAKFLNQKTNKVDESYKHELAELARDFQESNRERELELIKQIDMLV